MNRSNTTVESVMKLARKGLTKGEIADKLGYTTQNAYYQRIRYIFKEHPSELAEYKDLTSQAAKKARQKVQHKNTPKPINIKDIQDSLAQGLTKYQIVEKYSYRSFGGFCLTLRRTCRDDMLYRNMISKMDENTRLAALEKSKLLSKKEICEFLGIRETSLYATARSIFGDSDNYTIFFQNLKENSMKKEEALLLDVEPTNFPDDSIVLLQANNDATKKLDIYHHTYLINLSIDSLREELKTDHLKLIPRTLIDTMLKDKTQFKKHLVIISECLQRQSNQSLNDFITYYDTKCYDVTQHDYYMKLALLYQRKDYDVTLYCNIPKIIVDCLLYDIKVKHNVKYEYEIPEKNPIDHYIHGYDTSYLQNKHDDLQTAQPKLICECVLQEILKNNFNNLLYYIVDSNIPEHNFIFVRSSCAYLTSEYKRYCCNDSIILDTFQHYESKHKQKILVKTLDLNCQLEAMQLGFNVTVFPTDMNDNDIMTETEITSISRFDTLPCCISNMLHFVLCDDVSAVYYDAQLKHAISSKTILNKKYYKVEIGNYVVLKHCTNVIYKVVTFTDNIVNITLFKNNSFHPDDSNT